MSGHAGIDCAGYANSGILDRAEAAWGEVHWIGRYLPAYAPTADELAFLKQRGKALMCLWNGINGTTSGYGYQYGYDQGVAAAQAWIALGAPRGVAIIGDIEQPWYLSGEFAHGWLDGVHSQGCIPGLYLNPQYGSNHSAAWQYARSHSTAPGLVYTSQNEIYANQNRLVREFAIGPNAAQPVPGYEGDTHYWQSWENANGGEVDMDCASDYGYSILWGSTPPTPPKPAVKHYAIGTICGLKVSPSHSADMAINPQGRKVDLELGDTVLPTGKTAKVGGEAWSEVRLPNSPVHGWILKSCIKETA